MDIKIPKLIKPLDLSEYMPELKGQLIHVWVDPPRKIFQEYDMLVIEAEIEAAKEIDADIEVKPADASAETGTLASLKSNLNKLLSFRQKRVQSRASGTDKRILQWYSVIWSQRQDAVVSAEDIAKLEDENPAFFGWLIEQTWQMIRENRERNKKK